MSFSQVLKEKNVRYITIDNVDYFYVEDIQKSYKYFVLESDKIIYVDEIPLIDGKYVIKLSEFDQNMRKALNFKPNKKNKDV